MISEDLDTLDDLEYEEDADYDVGEVDDMLESLIESNGNGLAERARRRGRNARRKKGVKTAQGKSAFREPASGGFVSQKQFKEAMDRVGDDARRNAEGIKVVNDRVNALNGRVDGVVSVATLHSRALAKLEKRMKVTGALEFAQSYTNGALNGFQLLKGAAAMGLLGDGKGALSNPAVIGGLGFLLQNPSMLGNILNRQPGTT
jgi:hypothetical protein